jgi:hypothetical protein
MMEPKLIDLGWCMGKLIFDSRGVPAHLFIVSPSDRGDNTYTPAESVMVYGDSNIRKLFNALTEIYPVERRP